MFCESRRLRQAIESSLRIIYGLYTVVTLTFVVNLVLGMPCYLNLLQVMYITVISVPISTVFCLARPQDPKAMNYHVVSPKYLENRSYLESTNFYIKSQSLQVVLAAMFLVSMQILQLGLVHRQFSVHSKQIFQNWLILSDSYEQVS